MSAILKLVQGTDEWHQHRAKSRNASETPAVMGSSPWQTPYQLWQIRTGRVTQEVTAAMQHGADLEGAARAAYEAKTGFVMEPLVLQEGDYSASLDGIDLAGDLILEIKCPFKGRESALWKTAEVSEHYGWQVETQLMVSGAKLAHFWVFDGKDGILIEVVPRPERWPQIYEAWDTFMHYLDSDTPPPLTDKDVRLREDQEWCVAAKAYRDAKQAADEAAKILDGSKSALVALTSHSSEAGGGVTVTKYWKVGAVEYKKIPQLKGVDLEKFRGTSREEVRVTIA